MCYSNSLWHGKKITPESFPSAIKSRDPLHLNVKPPTVASSITGGTRKCRSKRLPKNRQVENKQTRF